MNKVIEFLKENPVQYLATVGRNGKAKVPPIYVFRRNGRKTVVLHQQHKRCLSRYAEQSDCQRTV